jgi:hypothetical protein
MTGQQSGDVETIFSGLNGSHTSPRHHGAPYCWRINNVPAPVAEDVIVCGNQCAQDAGTTAGASAVHSRAQRRERLQTCGVGQLLPYRPDRGSRPSQRMSVPSRTARPHRDRAETPCPIYSAALSGGPPAANAPPCLSATDQCAPLADRFHPIADAHTPLRLQFRDPVARYLGQVRMRDCHLRGHGGHDREVSQ